MRLNAFLARAGVASRRRADELIKAGRVTVNGEPGQLNTEAPRANWVDHGQVLAPLMHTFTKINVERFHVGENYLLAGER